MANQGQQASQPPLSAAALDAVPHMPGCTGACDITRHEHSGDGRIEYPTRQLPVDGTAKQGRQVVYVRWCVRPISESPEVWIERLAWADSSGVHVGDIEIVVNDAPGTTLDDVRAFGRLMEQTAAIAEKTLVEDRARRDGALDDGLQMLLGTRR
ncbi:hypothetical protein ABZ345_34170 [Lentzea sp. NPDC005914]|uniref:hypothetical protein n=1 Tax=Lentzea sp. NPDC005914 TaxID=3154572 RepID=UPI0033ED003F